MLASDSHIGVKVFSSCFVQRGLTMIEVLVALVILSVGVLGVAGLQGISKRTNHQALQRTQATHLADQIIERIRANPTAAAKYNTGLSSPLGGGTISAEPSPKCGINTCTAEQLAAHDLWVWEQAIDGAAITAGGNSAGGLVKPQGCIDFTAKAGKTNTGTLSVILAWEGMTDISDAASKAAETCGGVATGSDASRRQLVVHTYVFDPSES